MPNPGEIANLGKFQMFLEMCEVTKTLGGKLPPGLYLVFDAYSYPVIKSVRNDLLSAQTEIGIQAGRTSAAARPHMCGRSAALVRQVNMTGFGIRGGVPPGCIWWWVA